MNWSTSLSWLSALKDSHAPPLEEADPADMGTAFGLDASFSAPADPAPAELPAAEPHAATPAWDSRLIRRSGL